MCYRAFSACRSRLWQLRVAVSLFALMLPISVMAFSSNVRSAEELEYGAVLFEYFQRDYFSALVEQGYAQSLRNARAISDKGQLVKGGMLLSYGLADDAHKVFEDLLEQTVTTEVSNRAWFYLAKLHYNKGDFENARAAIDRIEGPVPVEVLVDYHYLATLVTGSESRLTHGVEQIEKTAQDSPYFPYFLFNLAVAQAADGDVTSAVTNLERITAYSNDGNDTRSALVDRARHGLAELAMRTDRLPAAWRYLSRIKSTGLYSNRALLSFAWAAINQEQFGEAIPALELLTQRSIALPEVQEAKVLLAHVYEQQGQLRRALVRNVRAEQDFDGGVQMIAEARRVIEGQEIPREFISNLEAIMDDTDWYARRPSVDYEKLTPFLVDLMASNAFNEALNELADLYAIEDNLHYWGDQAEQHQAILASADAKILSDEMTQMLARSQRLTETLSEKQEEISLYSVVLEGEERDRLTALMETVSTDLAMLNNKLKRLEKVDGPYQQPEHYKAMVTEHHQRIDDLLADTEEQILALEQVMRRLIKVELDKHEERMNYYAAQSRLAKARLYDMTLLSMEKSPALEEEGVKVMGETQ